MGILVTQHSMKNYKSRINKEIYLISGNVGTNFTLLFNLEKRYSVTEGAMNWTNVIKYSASKFLLV